MLLTQAMGDDMSKRIIDSPPIDEECEGFVTLYEGSEEMVVTEDEDIKPSVTVDKVKVEGCGCFVLFTRKGGMGKSVFLGGEGERIIKKKIRVRSVRKVKCVSYI
jgi:hypothetical protein